MKKHITKLATIMSMASIDGMIPLMATTGQFTIQNIPLIAFIFVAGPGSWLIASTTEGPTIERITVGIIAGLMATISVVIAAALGPVLLRSMNLIVVRIIGGIALFSVALQIMGVPIPNQTPTVLILLAIILGILL